MFLGSAENVSNLVSRYSIKTRTSSTWLKIWVTSTYLSFERFHVLTAQWLRFPEIFKLSRNNHKDQNRWSSAKSIQNFQFLLVKEGIKIVRQHHIGYYLENFVCQLLKPNLFKTLMHVMVNVEFGNGFGTEGTN